MCNGFNWKVFFDCHSVSWGWPQKLISHAVAKYFTLPMIYLNLAWMDIVSQWFFFISSHCSFNHWSLLHCIRCYLFIQCLIISMIIDYDIILVLFAFFFASIMFRILYHHSSTCSLLIFHIWWLFIILVWVNWFLSVSTVHQLPVCHLEYCFLSLLSQSDCNLYYKWGDLYLCSAKAPLLQGSGSRRVYRRKGTSLDRVYVCL